MADGAPLIFAFSLALVFFGLFEIVTHESKAMIEGCQQNGEIIIDDLRYSCRPMHVMESSS